MLLFVICYWFISMSASGATEDLCDVNAQSEFRQFSSAERNSSEGKHYRPCHWSICLVFDVCYFKFDKKRTYRVHLND